MKNRKFVGGLLLLFLPGFLVFQCWPLLSVAVQTVRDPEAFSMLLSDESFGLALKNTLIFTVCALVGLHILSFGLAWALYRTRTMLWVQTLLILPLAIPMIATTSVWRGFLQSYASTVLYSGWSFPMILVLYWWKYTGFHTLVYVAGLHSVHPSQIEAARLDGAGQRQMIFRIFLPQMTSFMVFNTVYGFSESFRIFRDVYVLFGSYPPRPIYLMQHYIQNHSVNLQIRQTFPAAAIFFVLTLLLLIPMLRRMRREEEDLAVE